MEHAGCLIRGTVSSADGQAIAEARVFFAAAPVPMPDIAALTDDNGVFVVRAPRPGRYELTIVADGFTPTEAAFPVEDSQHTLSLHIVLREL